jgi:hypothetical protein
VTVGNSGKIDVVKNVAYISGRELSAENGEVDNPLFVAGAMPPTTAQDLEIESDTHRLGLLDGMAWLNDIFSQFGGDWRVSMVSSPCPKGDTRILDLTRAEHRLQGTVELKGDVKVSTPIAHAHTLKREV